MTGLGRPREGGPSTELAPVVSGTLVCTLFPHRVFDHLQSGANAPAPRGSERGRRKAPTCLVEGESPPRNLNLQAAQGGEC